MDVSELRPWTCPTGIIDKKRSTMQVKRRTTGRADKPAPSGPRHRTEAARNEQEEALRRSEERLKLALEATTDGIWDWDIPTGEAVFSPRFYTMLGYEPYEFPQNYASFRGLVHPDDIDRVEHRVREYMERGGVYAIELRMSSRSGDWVWVLTRGKVVERDTDGRPVRMVGTHKDITERKLAEERIRESEERYRTVIESSPEGVALISGNRLVYANRRLSEMFGYATPEEIIQAGIEGVAHQDDVAMLSDYARRRQQGDTSVPACYEFRAVKKDGTRIFVEVSVSGISFEGRIMSLAYVKDITERKEAEKALWEYEKLVEGSTDMIAVVDRERRYRLANDTYLRYRGIKREDLVGQPCTEFIDPEVFETTVKGYLDRCFCGETVQYEMKYTYPGLGERDVLVSYAPVGGPDGIDRVAVITRDVSEHRKYEEALKESERLYRGLFETMPDGFASMNMDGKIKETNRAFREMLGYPQEEFDTLAYEDFTPEKWRGLEDEIIRKQVLTRGYSDPYEKEYVRRDGTMLPVEVRMHLLKGSDGAATGMCLFARDVSERKQAEDALMSREQELERKSFDLQEANTALKVLLRHRDEDKSSLESTIHANVKELIFPYIDKLRATQLSDAQATYVGIIESGLTEIISPFVQKMNAVYSRFTRTEIQVANLIRSGKSSKEIARTLNVSLSTVITHRNNIRNKLAIRHKNLNLQGYLLTL
jgi:PAS domain S-box-containing protein